MTLAMKTVALFLANEGHEKDLEDLLRSMVEPSRSEPGNLRYDLWQETEGQRRFVLDELYVDEAAVASHRASPHFRNYVGRIGEIATRTAVLAASVDVKAP